MDVKTRWNSSYLMVERYMEFENEINTYLKSSYNPKSHKHEGS